MSSSNSSSEIVHIGIGGGASTNNPVLDISSKYVHLQGLAGTSSSSATNIAATHCLQHGAYYVPRTVLVDHIPSEPNDDGSPLGIREYSLVDAVTSQRNDLSSIWNPGKIQELRVNNSTAVSNNAPNNAVTELSQRLSYTDTFSRYCHAASNASNSVAATSRAMHWDDNEVEPEEEYADDEYNYNYYTKPAATTKANTNDISPQQQIPQQQKQEWEDELDTTHQAVFDAFFGTTTVDTNVANAAAAANNNDETTVATSADDPTPPVPVEMDTSWQDHYKLAPYHPKSIIEVHQKQSDNNSSKESITERIRYYLEQCDCVQGLTLHTSNTSSLLTNHVITTWSDECSHVPILLYDISECSDDSASNKITATDVYSSINKAIQLDFYTEHCAAVIPIQQRLDNSRIAMALEVSTLPFRVTNASSSCIRLHSYYSGSTAGNYGGIPTMSFREYVRTLQRPSASRHVLEVDTNSSAATVDWEQQFLTGTSMEQKQLSNMDPRMRPKQRSSTKQQQMGDWLQHHVSSMTPVAPNTKPQNSDRSLHHHYCVSTCYRPAVASRRDTNTTAQCIMEGMGQRLRPEQYLACVSNQSMQDIIHHGYGVGSYWKHALCGTPAMVTVVGNTTRIYPFLYAMANTANEYVSTRRRSIYRSYYQRYVTAGLLPEYDDCLASITSLQNLVDSYEPPNGSELVMNDNATTDNSYY